MRDTSFLLPQRNRYLCNHKRPGSVQTMDAFCAEQYLNFHVAISITIALPDLQDRDLRTWRQQFTSHVVYKFTAGFNRHSNLGKTMKRSLCPSPDAKVWIHQNLPLRSSETGLQ